VLKPSNRFLQGAIGDTEIDLTLETRGPGHIETLTAALKEQGLRSRPPVSTFGMPGARELFKRSKGVRSLLVEGALDILLWKPAC